MEVFEHGKLHEDGLKTSGLYTSSHCCYRSPATWHTSAVTDTAGVLEHKKGGAAVGQPGLTLPDPVANTVRLPSHLWAATQGLLLRALLPKEQDVVGIFYIVLVEQFVTWLLAGQAKWFQCHWLTSLNETIYWSRKNIQYIFPLTSSWAMGKCVLKWTRQQ